MKSRLLCAVLLVAMLFALNSCSSGSSESVIPVSSPQTLVSYSYNDSELEAMNLINTYRISLGLNALEKINYISVKSEEHVVYMIKNNVVNHDDFVSRSESIVKYLGAKSVAENVAYNYATPKAAVEAWLKSQGHKDNIEGNFTHFGIAIKEDPATGKKYYTNIFAKI